MAICFENSLKREQFFLHPEKKLEKLQAKATRPENKKQLQTTNGL